MSLLAEPIPSVAPQPIRWTRSEYHRLAETGVFEGKRVELIEGSIIHMAPMGPLHWTAGLKVRDCLMQEFASGFLVIASILLGLGAASDPEPDVAVIPGTLTDLQGTVPKSALLVVEVSDSSLAYDRWEKASMYAKAGIQDYWIVNIPHRHIEVYRLPQPNPEMPFGHGYSLRQIHLPGEAVSPLCRPSAVFQVDEFLP